MTNTSVFVQVRIFNQGLVLNSIGRYS